MPARDATGPMGRGPKTGRGLGNCNPANVSRQSFFGRVFRRGFGQGNGRGFGRGFGIGYTGYQASVSLEEEKTILEDRLATIDQELKNIKSD